MALELLRLLAFSGDHARLPWFCAISLFVVLVILSFICLLFGHWVVVLCSLVLPHLALVAIRCLMGATELLD